MHSEKEKIKVDYSNPDYPTHARNFMPDVYRDENGYHCILGNDSENAIVASGSSVEESIQNWEEAYTEKTDTQQ